MKVYVLEYVNYDDFHVLGIFTSMEKASAAKEEFLAEHSSDALGGKYTEDNFEITEKTIDEMKVPQHL
ncbi:hypothetical protein LU196_13125 [Pantoea sp. Mb-10]|uniref:DUF7336 domain-containing protein n=1 Tax=unclassified Pantoea TaxID=2630326 RepID=UPI001E5322B3|nr:MULTISPECIES: hypothetical protein [unclassified Pantoea]MCE0490982.1 hypothetical protein [Pantoea sp. Mb-10]MCE0499860.1 hypothetical protein [Pantoea sp. Pb-8]